MERFNREAHMRNSFLPDVNEKGLKFSIQGREEYSTQLYQKPDKDPVRQSYSSPGKRQLPSTANFCSHCGHNLIDFGY